MQRGDFKTADGARRGVGRALRCQFRQLERLQRNELGLYIAAVGALEVLDCKLASGQMQLDGTNFHCSWHFGQRISMNNLKDMVRPFRARRTEDTQKGPARYYWGSGELCDGAPSNLTSAFMWFMSRILYVTVQTAY